MKKKNQKSSRGFIRPSDLALVAKVSNGTRESIKNFNLYKACFQHDMAYEIFKDLFRRTGSKKVLSNKA